MFEIATFCVGVVCGSVLTTMIIMFFMGANDRR